ncbi:unnamed protein product [Penicillium egyptiacum]|uniref:Uncharacterized protein n=1 Tax=Penicillium egyptiacum TaxID=1303716 RepID=A0A9W4P233_9EURO|nr:unnamed protein product [Penicillium egyptiacum]
MYIPQKRQNETYKNNIFIICAVSIIFAIALCVGTFFLLRYLRQRNYEPKYLPGKYLKRKWKEWGPRSGSYGQVPNQSGRDTSYRGAGTAPEMQTTDGVRRDTSIRSIMTLPPYSQSPKPTEQVIAREGERGGMDMVVEYPETAEEQETRREEQMDSMYQIRLQRRQELADREARRRERREARARGDSARLEQLNAETRARSERRRAGTNSAVDVSALLAEHQSRERDRRISSVSYAEIGRVRHDGSRLRADSHNSDFQDSDSRPLLQSDAVSSAAPSFEPSSLDSRGQSIASSITSESHHSTELERLTLAPTTTHGSSRPVSQTDDGDLGTLNIPPPPDYEYLDWGDAPAYQSPVTEQNEQARQLPPIDRLPSIHVNLPSPMTVSPVTPTQSQFQNININNDGPPTPTERTSGIRMVSAGSATTIRGPPPILNDSTPESSH